MFDRKIQPIEDTNKTISSIAQERIRSAILEGILPPGSRIDQNQLARDLNTSLVPVREALKKLESEGFVQIFPRRGAFVTAVSIEDMEDLYRARVILESQTGYHAAANLKEADLNRLRGLHTAMNEALQRQDYDEFSRLNRQFHFIIFEAAGSKYLCKVIAGLWDLAERYRYRSALLKDRAQAIRGEHQAMLDACESHDAAALRDAISVHVNRTLEGVRAFLHHASAD